MWPKGLVRFSDVVHPGMGAKRSDLRDLRDLTIGES